MSPEPPWMLEGKWPQWCQREDGTDDTLHVVRAAVWAEPPWDESDWWVRGEGTTVCGLVGMLTYPGVLSRMGARRCGQCCEAVGVPAGTGHPKNDAECRVLLGYDAAEVPGA